VNDVSSKELPQRAMDEAAIEVFKGIMRELQAANKDDLTACWLWPSVKAWPEGMKPLPEDYSAYIMGEGYGQFVLKAVKSKFKQLSPIPYAHVLSYKHFTLPALLSKYFPQSDVTITSLTKDGMSKRTDFAAWQKEFEDASLDYADNRLVRHIGLSLYDSCPRNCVNPDHLARGTDALNRLDRDLKANKDKPIPAIAENKRLPILADFDNGDFNAQSIGKRHGKSRPVAQWVVVRIVMEAGRSNWRVLLHDFNPMDIVDNKPKDMR
jgi:hypothetical protein